MSIRIERNEGVLRLTIARPERPMPLLGHEDPDVKAGIAAARHPFTTWEGT